MRMWVCDGERRTAREAGRERDGLYVCVGEREAWREEKEGGWGKRLI